MQKKLNFKAAVLTSKNKIILERLEFPELRYGQALIKMLFSSICHTQVQEINGQRGKDNYLPHCLGHEAVGTIVDKHKSVRKVNLGDKVCLSWIKGKGIDSGGTQYKNIKGKIINAGPVNTFSEYAVVSENRIYKLSKNDHNMSSVLLGCAIPTAFNSIFYSLKDVKYGPICIFGCGGVGLSTIMASKIKKISPIIGIDINNKKLTSAKKFGANKTFNFKNVNFKNKLKAYCKSNFPIIIECTGKIEVLNFCIDVVNSFGGKILVIGNYPKPAHIKFDPWNIINGKTLMGAWNDKDFYDYKINFFKKKLDKNYHKNFFGKKIYTLDQINIALSDFKKGKIVRPLIKFN